MKNFAFFIDQKITDWEREKYHIQAETEEEAIEIMKTIFDGTRPPENYLAPYRTELVNFRTRLSPQSDGIATKELFIDLENGNDVPIYDNAFPPIK